MRNILQQRGLRFVFAANIISMLGSGMNTAAVTWSILQRTHSEIALGTLAVLGTLPGMLMLPFTGVIIDREDRRHLVMMLDAGRAVVVAVVAALALRGEAKTWQLYLMTVFVAAGFWMFWPTITALIQELTPESEFVHANTFLLAGVQGGWLIAGSIVGFVYDRLQLTSALMQQLEIQRRQVAERIAAIEAQLRTLKSYRRTEVRQVPVVAARSPSRRRRS